MSEGELVRFDAPQARAWARSFMKGVKKRLRDLRALVQGVLGKLAPETSLGQPA